MKLKSLVFKFLTAFAKPSFKPKKEDEFDLEQAWEEEQAAFHKHRKEQYNRLAPEWIKPENIAARRKQFEEDAPKAIERALLLKRQIRESLGMPLEDPPLPDPLPKEMQGQSESTIRAMLRQRSWKYDIDLKVWSKK